MNRKDIMLIIGLLVIAGIGMVWRTGQDTGSQVVILIDGEEYGRYPLRQDKRIEVSNEHGYNLVVIEDGRVRIEEADCPDRYCVKQGRISGVAESLVCLPHKLIVEVRSDEETEIDSISR